MSYIYTEIKDTEDGKNLKSSDITQVGSIKDRNAVENMYMHPTDIKQMMESKSTRHLEPTESDVEGKDEEKGVQNNTQSGVLYSQLVQASNEKDYDLLQQTGDQKEREPYLKLTDIMKST